MKYIVHGWDTQRRELFVSWDHLVISPSSLMSFNTLPAWMFPLWVFYHMKCWCYECCCSLCDYLMCVWNITTGIRSMSEEIHAWEDIVAWWGKTRCWLIVQKKVDRGAVEKTYARQPVEELVFGDYVLEVCRGKGGREVKLPAAAWRDLRKE